MIPASESLAFDLGVPPMPDIVPPERADAAICFYTDPELRNRIEELALTSTEGQLMEAERAEYTACERTNSSPFSNDKHISAAN